MQIISAVASFNLDVPEGIFKFQDTLSQPVTLSMNSLDCFLVNIRFIDIPLIYFRVFWQMLLPIAYWLIFSFLLLLYSLVV
jgi:hypothetical protein